MRDEHDGLARGTKLAEKPLQAMSGGQRQRVLLAKVLAQQTPVLLPKMTCRRCDFFPAPFSASVKTSA